MLYVPKKEMPNFNFSLPEEIALEFRLIGDVHGERNKLRWSVAAAAVLKLLEMPPNEMHELIRQVAGARHYPEKLSEMVGKAKQKAAGDIVYIPVSRADYESIAERAAFENRSDESTADVPTFVVRLCRTKTMVIDSPIPPEAPGAGRLNSRRPREEPAETVPGSAKNRPGPARP